MAVCIVWYVIAFLCLLLVIDDSPLTEPSESMVARVAVGKSVSTLCQAFVPIHCVWQGNCPWHVATPSLPFDSDKRASFGGGGVCVVKIVFILSCGARAIYFVPENHALERRVSTSI